MAGGVGGLGSAIAGIRSFAANAMWAAKVFVQAGRTAKVAEGMFASAAENMEAAGKSVAAAAATIATADFGHGPSGTAPGFAAAALIGPPPFSASFGNAPSDPMRALAAELETFNQLSG